MRILSGLLIAMTFAATTASAQIPSTVQRGDRIGVRTGASEQWIDGRLARFSSDTIYMERCANCRPAAFVVAGLSGLRIHREHRHSNAILGAAAGSAIGFLWCTGARCRNPTTHADHSGVVIASAALLGGIFGTIGAGSEWTEINLHPDSGTPTPVLEIIKEPSVAVMWGIAVPGGGQMYADNWPKGLLIFGGTTVIAVSSFAAAFCVAESCNNKSEIGPLIGLGAAAALWVYGFASAPRDAMRYNAEHQPGLPSRVSLGLGRTPAGRPEALLRVAF